MKAETQVLALPLPPNVSMGFVESVTKVLSSKLMQFDARALGFCRVRREGEGHVLMMLVVLSPGALALAELATWKKTMKKMSIPLFWLDDAVANHFVTGDQARRALGKLTRLSNLPNAYFNLTAELPPANLNEGNFTDTTYSKAKFDQIPCWIFSPRQGGALLPSNCILPVYPFGWPLLAYDTVFLPTVTADKATIPFNVGRKYSPLEAYMLLYASIGQVGPNRRQV
jgi:hypothetical protein